MSCILPKLMHQYLASNANPSIPSTIIITMGYRINQTRQTHVHHIPTIAQANRPLFPPPPCLSLPRSIPKKSLKSKLFLRFCPAPLPIVVAPLPLARRAFDRDEELVTRLPLSVPEEDVLCGTSRGVESRSDTITSAS